MNLRNIIAASLFLFVNYAPFAKETVYYLYPPDYVATCKEYADMTGKGLSVKAERLAEKYRKNHIYPTFWLEPSETKKIRLVNNSGWQPTSMGADYHLREIEDESTDYNENPHSPSSLIDIRIPKKDLERWQDFMVKWFPSPESGEPEKFKKHISEIVISIENRDDKGRSAVRDCFDPDKKSSQFNIYRGVSGDVILISYKLADRKIAPDTEKSRNDATTQGENLKSQTAQPQESSGSPIIDAIVRQGSDRYDVVRDILRQDPGQANGLAMSFKFTVYQSGKVEDRSEQTLYAINAAIRVKDVEMVKLLVEHNAQICWNSHVLSPASECAIRYAAENGTPEIHEYLKKIHREKADQEVFLVVFGSELSGEEKVKACEELTERLGYEDGTKGIEQKKRTKALCPTVKEFITRKIRPGMRIISK